MSERHLGGVDKDRREAAQCRVSGSEQVGEEGLQSPGGLGGGTHSICGWVGGCGMGRL